MLREAPEPPPHVIAGHDATQAQLGAFLVEWGGGRLRVSHARAPARPLFAGLREGAWLSAGRGDTEVRESRGFFTFHERRVPQMRPASTTLVRDSASSAAEAELRSLCLRGTIVGDEGPGFTLRFEALDDEQLRFEVDAPGHNRLELACEAVPDERVFGFGEQFTVLDVKGRCVPVLSQEPGIGRGVQPLTWVMNTFFGAGGSWSHSNAPVPHFLTTALQSLSLENTEYSEFDFRAPRITRIRVHADRLCGRLYFGETPLDLVEVHTRYAGRMPALPEWVGGGAIIGMQGGRRAVEEKLARLREARVPVAAFWLQDWVGSRRTAIGKQLWWNWESDEQAYPEWPRFVGSLREQGIRVLGYVNPFLVDATAKGDVRRNLHQEARARGYLVRRADGSPYDILNTSFSAVLLDLTNPEACAWLKEVLRAQLEECGVSGWMADFGEALPFDAQLADGSDPATYHNRYPIEWARLNREVVEESGALGDALFFARAGFTRSPAYATLFWLGDQLTSWRREDGIPSALLGLLSSGFSGFSLNHSDIGGYTATTAPRLPLRLPGISFVRGPELLRRWIELNAFTAVFRTHEGNQPDRHHQIDDDPVTLAHFARFARIYAALAPYRRQLCRDAEARGWPLVRHPWMHYPDDEVCASLDLQFMLGPDFWIAPVLAPGVARVRVYLPAGRWQHLWSAAPLGDEGRGGWHEVDAPLGRPAVYCRADSSAGHTLRETLAAQGDL